MMSARRFPPPWTAEEYRGSSYIVRDANADNYLIDVKFGIIVDVEASRAIRQAEVGAAKTMIERAEERFDLKPQYLAADTAYGSAETLNWIVNDKRIAPHIPVVDKSGREDGSLSRDDFAFARRATSISARRASCCKRRLRSRWDDPALSRKGLGLWSMPTEASESA
jgi:hypothetical protein